MSYPPPGYPQPVHPSPVYHPPGYHPPVYPPPGYHHSIYHPPSPHHPVYPPPGYPPAAVPLTAPPPQAPVLRQRQAPRSKGAWWKIACWKFWYCLCCSGCVCMAIILDIVLGQKCGTKCFACLQDRLSPWISKAERTVTTEPQRAQDVEVTPPMGYYGATTTTHGVGHGVGHGMGHGANHDADHSVDHDEDHDEDHDKDHDEDHDEDHEVDHDHREKA